MLLGDFRALSFSGEIRTLALAAGFVGRYSDSQHVFGRHLDVRRTLSVQMSPDNALRVRNPPVNAMVSESRPATPKPFETRPLTLHRRISPKNKNGPVSILRTLQSPPMSTAQTYDIC